MKHEGTVKSLVLDVSTLAEGVDNLKLQCLQDRDHPDTSPLDAQLLTDFLSGGDAVAHKFCAYGNNGSSRWREPLFEALTARGWKSVKSNHRNYTPLKRCIEQLDEVGALSASDELILVLGKMTATVSDLLAPFVKRGCNLKIFMFSCHKDAVRQLHLRGRIVALDDKVVNFVRPDLQPRGVDVKSRVAGTANGVVTEDQTDFEADAESLGSNDTSDELNDMLSDEDGGVSGEELEERPRSVIDASGTIPPIVATPRNDELDGESERNLPNETDNDADSDATEEEDWRSSRRRRGVADNVNPQEQAAATPNDRVLHESTSYAPDNEETEEEDWDESDSDTEASLQVEEVRGCQEGAPGVKYEEDKDCDEIRDGMALPISSTRHTASQQPGINLPQPESDSDEHVSEKTEKSNGADLKPNDAEADDEEAPICSLEAVAAKLVDMLASLFGRK